MHLRWGPFKQLGVVYQEFFRKHRFATSRGSHHQDRGGSMKTKRFPRLHDDDTTQGGKKGTFLLESVGLEPTRDPLMYPGGSKGSTHWATTPIHFFSNKFYLIIPLMIRMTTELIPSGFLAYNQLLKALTGLMVIAYIIMIGKLI